MLAVPAIEFFFGELRNDKGQVPTAAGARRNPLLSRTYPALAVLVALTIAQGAIFQWQFHRAPPRVDAFDSYYPQVLDAALARPERPVYLLDKTPAAYMYAFWYATLRGVDLNNFQRANQDLLPPGGAVVISHELPCTNCEMIFERGQFRVYRQK